MSPEIKTALRRIAILVTGSTQAVIAYVLHSFSGWPRIAMLGACLVSLGYMIHFLIDEGRERERERS